MDTEYHFVSVWRVAGTVSEVTEILKEPEDLPRWWLSVYLAVKTIKPNDDDGTGGVAELYTKGWLPYTLRWSLTVTEPVNDSGFAISANGDFVGTGRWTFEQDGPEVVVTYDWRISAEKTLLRRLTWLLRPIFSANHHWAMAKGEESIKLELRRRGAKPEDRAKIPLPPGPTFRWLLRT